VDRDTSATAPIITGTYLCDTVGTYTVTLFRSGSQSGYGFRLSGLETGTYTAFTEAPGSLGTCGLSIQFTEDESYGNKVFEVTIPNTRSASYSANYNTYVLAREQQTNAVRNAEQALEKVLREQTLANATPRDEENTRALATILQTEARIRAIDARIRERTLRAPFSGVITNIDFTVGEVSTGKTMSLVASDIFELTVRVPEIDITRLALGQPADVRFDARPEELVRAHIGFISETATEIDGVAYFEAKLQFTNPPVWFRSGLNADVDIIVSENRDVLRVPKRFVVTENGTSHLLYPEGAITRKVPVELLFTGNDGFTTVSGDVREGDAIVAP
jgi:RND family efflux transporter MFP subunit